MHASSAHHSPKVLRPISQFFLVNISKPLGVMDHAENHFTPNQKQFVHDKILLFTANA